jgi:WD40 repeat protein
MTTTKILELNGHSGAVYSLAHDGNFIYSASADQFVARWDLKTGIQDKFSIKADAPVYAIATINNNKILVIGLSNGAIHLIDIEQKKELKYIQQHPSAVFYITENKFKKQVYSSDASGNFAVWDAASFDLLLFIPLDSGKIRRIAISPDGASIAVCCQDGKIRIFDTTFFNETYAFRGHDGGANTACYIGKNLLLSGGKDAMLRLWDLNKNILVHEIPAHNYAIYDLMFLRQNNKIISCSRDKTIKVWSAENLAIVSRIDRKLGGHFHSVNSICKMDDTHFATCSDDKRIIVWKIEND